MQMLYNSDSFVVLQFDVPVPGGPDATDGPTLARGGYEIVDKLARKEIFLEGLMAESFKTGVQAIADGDASPEAFDAFIGRYSALAQQPVVAH
jgi:hypothetical protein